MRSVEAIIFYHRGKSDSLEFAIDQARKTNPDKRVLLLGDATSAGLARDAEFRDADQYLEDVDAFRDAYIHLSSNKYFVEAICIERWISIRNLCRAEGIDRFLYVDSDALLFEDANIFLRERDADFDHSLSEGMSAHISYWTRDTLVAFCAFVADLYALKDRATLDEVLRFYRSFPRDNKKGGVCDMTLLRLFARTTRWVELTAPVAGAVFDDNINATTNGPLRFRMRDGVKAIGWTDGRPYGVDDATGTRIRFRALHFQGGKSKRRIAEVCFPDRRREPRLLRRLRRWLTRHTRRPA